MSEVKSEQDWQAESDASTLISAEEIKMDNARLKKALVAAKAIKRKQEARAAAINKIAKTKKE